MVLGVCLKVSEEPEKNELWRNKAALGVNLLLTNALQSELVGLLRYIRVSGLMLSAGQMICY